MTVTLIQAPPSTVAAEGVICGAILRECRRLLRLRQEAMAEKLMVDLDTYRSWEHGRRPITRLAMHRYKALARGLSEIGSAPAYVALLDSAVELDIAIGRALLSEDNPFIPPGPTDSWYALLMWALVGIQPLPASSVGTAGSPRLSHVDTKALIDKIWRTADQPPGDVDADTIHALKAVCLRCPPCPPWCDRTCEPYAPDSDAVLHTVAAHVASTPERIGDVDGSVRVTAWSFDDHDGPIESGVELNLTHARTLIRAGYANFSAYQARHLAAALNHAADLIDHTGGIK